MYRTLFLFSLAIIAIGCDKSKNQTTYNDIPVIEAYLQAGSPVSVKIKHQVPFSTVGTLGNVDSLQLELTDDSVTVLLKRVDTGAYCDGNLLARAGHNYTLKFLYNNKSVMATTHVPEKPADFKESASSISVTKITQGSFPTGGFSQPDPIDLSWYNPDAAYYMVLVKNIESNPELIFDTTGIGKPPSAIFRNQPTTNSSFSINSNQFQYFGQHLIVLFRLNADYAALYNTNGTTSQNLTTLSNGITNAEGIFTGINSDTLTLKVNKK
jgi:hypothetical protein